MIGLTTGVVMSLLVVWDGSDISGVHAHSLWSDEDLMAANIFTWMEEVGVSTLCNYPPKKKNKNKKKKNAEQNHFKSF